MANLSAMLWVELRKAYRSGMPLYTALGSLFFPLGIGFLIFVARNPQLSQQLGLISAKANLLAYSTTDWSSYLNLLGMILAAGGFFLFSLVIAWVFGREFADGTVKDLLAVPVPRLSLLLAKFIVVALWAAGLSLLIWMVGLGMGALIGLPGGSSAVLLHGSFLVLGAAGLTIAVAAPLGLLASMGRGYLLPMAGTLLVMMTANLMGLAGWGEFFPWAVPGLFAQDKQALGPASFWIVFLTGLAGIVATYGWWQTADQNR